MEKKSNFRKAYADLASMVGIESSNEEETVAPAPVVPENDPSSPERIVEDFFATMVDAPVKKAPVYAPATVIAADATITGDVAAGSLEIYGNVIGTVTAKGSVLVRGNVTGNITADSITIESGSVTADLITATDKIEVGAGTSLSSNIQCGNIAMYATLKGNLTATGNCVLYNTAVIEGNLKAATISVSTGAVIKGMVEISK